MSGDRGGEALDHLSGRTHDGRRHLGRVPGATVGERAVGHGLLDGGDVGPALAEGHLDVVALGPGGVGEGGRVLGVELDPLGLAVDPSLGLARKVDPGQLAEAVLGRLVLDGHGPVLGSLLVEQGAQVVEEVVARHGQGRRDVVVAGRVAGAVVEDARRGVVLTTRGLEHTAVVVREAGGDQAGLKGGGGRVELERRPRGVETFDGPVEQGFVVRRSRQRRIVGVADAAHPDGRVVARVRGHGVDRPRLGAHDHDGTAGGRRFAAGVVVALGVVTVAESGDLGGEGVVGHLLEIGVEIGDDVVSRLGRRRLEDSGHLALGIHLEFLLARGAAQLGLVLVLETRLAEGIAGLVALGCA